MKKILILFAAFCFVVVTNAQRKTFSSNDANLDGHVDISDVNSVISEICGNGKSVRVVPVDSICALLRTINADVAKQVEKELGISDDPVTPTPISSNLLPGKFSVSATKQVQFTKSNIYWDGTAFHFEENQTDYPTSWDANHVGHFYWTNLTDYKSGNAAYMPYAESYSYSSRSTSDKFWCGEDNPLTVDGTDGLYALTGSGSGEWYYLIYSRTNASNLRKHGVTVTNGETNYTNCLIIAPDDYTDTLQTNYSLDEVNAAGLVCLPAAGYYNGNSLFNCDSYGYYWSATPFSISSKYAYQLSFSTSLVSPTYQDYSSYGRSLRLVRSL